MYEALGLPPVDPQQIARISVRLLLAILCAGALGFERELRGKAAGLRTHMLVGLGAAIFTLTIVESTDNGDALSRVIQGVATGIGFVGAGAILKPNAQESQVKGLTTATSVWLSAALGVGIGAGQIWLVLLATVFALFTMSVLGRLEREWLEREPKR
jgi:putative Mg2+ transporter-C (MgtC) family protein